MARTVRATMVIEGLEVGAGGVVKAGDLVGFSGGKLIPAVGTAVLYTPARGVALTSGEGGELVAMALRGEVSGLSGLPTRGGSVYLSEDAAGGISGSPAGSAGGWAQRVGWSADGESADSGTSVVVTFQDEGAEV